MRPVTHDSDTRRSALGDARRQLSVAWYYLLQALKMRMAYRLDFFVECLSSLVAEATGLIVIWVIFQNTPALGGWDQWQVVFIYGVAMISRALFGTVSYSFWQFASRYIMEGEFDRLLLRPVNPLLQLGLENIRFEQYPNLFAGVGLIVLAADRMAFEWGAGDVALLVAFTAGGGLLLIGLFLAVTTTSFWFEDRVGLAPPLFNLMAFGKYPLTIFNSLVRFVLSFVIPFGFMAFYPATHFLQRGSNEFALFCYLTPVVGAGVFAAGYGVWLLGIRSYRSTGS